MDGKKKRKRKTGKPATNAVQLGEAAAEVVAEAKAAQKRARGRPSTYSEMAAGRVLEAVSNGQTLRQACREDGMPPEGTVRMWRLDDVNGFAARYARARAMQLECWADGMLDISDDGSNDWETRVNEKGQEYDVVNHEVIGRANLRINTRKWLMSKLRPDLYGDKVQVDTPEDGPIARALSVTSDAILALTRGA